MGEEVIRFGLSTVLLGLSSDVVDYRAPLFYLASFNTLLRRNAYSNSDCAHIAGFLMVSKLSNYPLFPFIGSLLITIGAIVARSYDRLGLLIFSAFLFYERNLTMNRRNLLFHYLQILSAIALGVLLKPYLPVIRKEEVLMHSLYFAIAGVIEEDEFDALHFWYNLIPLTYQIIWIHTWSGHLDALIGPFVAFTLIGNVGHSAATLMIAQAYILARYPDSVSIIISFVLWFMSYVYDTLMYHYVVQPNLNSVAIFGIRLVAELLPIATIMYTYTRMYPSKKSKTE